MSSVAGMTVITAQTAASLLMPADARNENNFCVSISILKHAESKIEMWTEADRPIGPILYPADSETADMLLSK